jgi:SAM-dependent methyltransferase
VHNDEELQAWFAEVRSILETAYKAAETPWGQSGIGSPFEDWTRLRIPICECITRSGTFLDIGCASGFLLECLREWTSKKGIEIVPYGLDYSPIMLQWAQERLPAFKEKLFLGNAWDWQPPCRFDYVNTATEYVPRNLCFPYLQRLLSDFLTEDGTLLVARYRSRNEDLSRGWIDDELKAAGFNVVGVTHGFNGQGLEQCRVTMLRR